MSELEGIAKNAPCREKGCVAAFSPPALRNICPCSQRLSQSKKTVTPRGPMQTHELFARLAKERAVEPGVLLIRPRALVEDAQPRW